MGSSLSQVKRLSMRSGSVTKILHCDRYNTQLVLHCRIDVYQRGSKVVMFSPGVFVCVCVCACVSVTMIVLTISKKDWRHSNNILHVYRWGCVHAALMLSSMTSPGQKIGQISKVP